MEILSELEGFDYHDCRNCPEITDQLDYGEEIYFSGTVTKFNKMDWKQERLFLVTNIAIYNIKKYKIQRRIPIKDIGKQSVSIKVLNYVLV